jgi:hypothetical protein
MDATLQPHAMVALTLFDRRTRRVLQVKSLPRAQAAAQASEKVGVLEGEWPSDRFKVHALHDEAVPLEPADAPAVSYQAHLVAEYPGRASAARGAVGAIEALAEGPPTPPHG